MKLIRAILEAFKRKPKVLYIPTIQASFIKKGNTNV